MPDRPRPPISLPLGVVLHQVLTGEHPRFGVLSHSLEPTVALEKADIPPLFIQAVKDFLSNDTNTRCQAFEQIKSTLLGSSASHSVAQPTPPSRRLTRRHFAYGAAVTACAAAGGIAWRRHRVSEPLSPLPTKKFVALLGWPLPTDERVEPVITAVVNAIGTELARAEAFDSNFYVIPHRVGKDIVSLSQVNDVRKSLGATLVLSASAAIVGSELQLLLRVLDSSAKALREKSISVSLDEQLSLPGKAVRAAATLLDIVKLDLADQRNSVGTNNPEAYGDFQKAEGYRAQPNDRELDTAIDFYTAAVNKDPRYALAKARLARAFFRRYVLKGIPGDLASAESNCQSAIHDNSNLVEAHLAQASVMEWRGNKSGALDETAKALAIDGRDPAALLQQGQQLTRSNSWQDAQEIFARLQLVRPNFWLLHEEWGVAYSEDGKYQQAVEEFSAANVAAPEQSLPLTNLSTVYLQKGNVKTAIEFAKKSLAVAQDDHGAAAMAEALRCKGKFVEALSYALTAKTRGPKYPDNWLQLGNCYSSLRGRHAEEFDAFVSLAELQRTATDTNTADGPGWMFRALAEAKTGEYERSMVSLHTAELNCAGDVDSQLRKVRTLELLKKYEEAFDTAKACLARGVTPFQFEHLPDIDNLRNDLKFKDLLRSHQSH